MKNYIKPGFWVLLTSALITFIVSVVLLAAAGTKPWGVILGVFLLLISLGLFVFAGLVVYSLITILDFSKNSVKDLESKGKEYVKLSVEDTAKLLKYGAIQTEDQGLVRSSESTR